MTATLPTLRSVTICPKVQTRLCQLAFEVFTSRPKEGESIGGVLVGKTTRDGVEVTDYWQGAEDRADVVGFWSIERRVRQELKGKGVLIVVAPVTVQRAEALVWQREADGEETEARRMTFQIERRVQKRDARRSEVKPVAAPAVSHWREWSLAAACIVLGGLTGWMMRAEAQSADPQITLQMEGGSSNLRVRWKETGGGPLESAVLMVRQGPEQEAVDLMDQYKPDGVWTVAMNAPEVVVSLRVRRKGMAAMERTVTYLNPQPASPAPKIGEVEWLRWRNKQLEAAMAARIDRMVSN